MMYTLSQADDTPLPVLTRSDDMFWFKKETAQKKPDEECPIDDATLLMIGERSRIKTINTSTDEFLKLVEEVRQARLQNKPLPKEPEIHPVIKKRMEYLRAKAHFDFD